MNYLLIVESFGSYGANDDLGIALLLAVPVLLIIALIFFIAGIVKKTNSAKMFRNSGITFIAAGVCAIVGLGSCGWFN